MKRFQNVSKYRNAVLSAAKRGEGYTFQSSNECLNTAGDGPILAVSTRDLAFRSGSGNVVAIRALSDTGRTGTIHQVHVGAQVTDLQWSPFTAPNHTETLATAADDGAVKLWDFGRLPEAHPSSPAWNQTCHDGRIDNILFHPTAHGLLTTSGGPIIKLWDVTGSGNEPTLCISDAGDLVQSLSWKEDGSILVAVSKDNLLRVYDPRKGPAPITSGEAHAGIKPSRALFLGSSDLMFTTGFSQRRDREYAVWDSRNLSKPLVLTKLDTSPGAITPLYDSDTGMLFLVGKGETRITWLEVKTDGAASPITPGVLSFTSGTVLSAAALVRKTSLNVMDCEVARLLCAASDGNSIIPVSVTVPRKSHMEFHADLFPDAVSSDAALTAEQWFQGENALPDRLSLDPKKASRETMVSASTTGPPKETVESSTFTRLPAPNPAPSSAPLTSVPSSSKPVPASTPPPSAGQPIKPAPKFVLPKASSFRFITGKAQSAYDDLKGLSTTVPGESTALEVNDLHLAFPMTGSGGRIGIWPVGKTGRLPSKIPMIVCGSELMDFQLDPFDATSLVTATDDGKIRRWKVPSEGLAGDLSEPESSFTAHSNRITFSMFHPTISNLLLTASPEQGSPSVKLWNLKSQELVANMPHPDLVMGCCFNFYGTQLVTVCRDRQIRVFDLPGGKESLIGPSHEGIKGCRVLWLKDGNILSVGFGKASQRELRVYDATNLASPLFTTTIDTSPSLLIPFYDEDTSILYLTGRGESYTMMFEITSDGPQFLTRFDSGGSQQGLAFAPKTQCDVRAIEIAKGYRISQTAIETVSFTVPRLKKEFFQDDLYPPTSDTSKPMADVGDWLQGKKGNPSTIDMRPPDMIPLSQAPVEVKEQVRAIVLEREQTEAEVKAAGMKQMFELAQQTGEEEKLPQDELEGVDDDEWD
ncbi:Coronin-7 [Thoreauomyces humboldtii]|nr:Coronin-7 [Thoreauomyces humboldtii]